MNIKVTDTITNFYQAHAGAALVNFVEDCPTATILPYLEPLCGKLEQVLSQRIQNVSLFFL